MCEQRRLLIGVKRAERRPQLGRSVGQTVGPDLVTFVDRARDRAVVDAGRVDAKAAAPDCQLDAALARRIAVEGVEHQGVQHRGEGDLGRSRRSEEHTSELKSLMRISYAVFCLKK